MYTHSRQNNQYPVPAPPAQRPGASASATASASASAAALPPPPQLQDPAAYLLPPPQQQSLAPQHLAPQHLAPQHLPPQPLQMQPHQQPPHQQPPHQQPPHQPRQIVYDVPPADANGDFVGQKDGRSFRLRVDQQPIRARMCGFGDKDRRPITPPPCIRLIMSDALTGQEIDANEIDTTFFQIIVDLCHEDISRGACNLVRHSSAAPTVSISSSVTTSFPPQPDRQVFLAQVPHQYAPYGQQLPPQHAYAHQPHYYPNQPPPGYPSYVPNYPPPAPAPATSQSNHTRNLIGQASVNAFKLNDPDGKPGFWFVLQDLSVRTEGTFRLKFMIFNIGSGTNSNSILGHNEKTPMLASCFSDPFTVYSAKKFPGVIESTALSKCFAQQGIKIPIRKDGPRNVANQNEYDNDD